MFDGLVRFLKETFTYEETSSAETPKVVQSQEHKPLKAKSSRQDGRSGSAGAAVDIPLQSAKDGRSTGACQTSPQSTAQQQTSNFANMRPRPEDERFRMIVDAVFYAKGGGVVARGTVGVGIVRTGNRALIVHAANRTTLQTRIVAVEKDGKVVQSAPAGSTVGLLLEQITRNDIHAGDVIGAIE